MGDWYSIGVFAGLGVALGVAAAGVLGGRRFALAAAFAAAVSGIALGMMAALCVLLIPRFGAIGAAVSLVATRAVAAAVIVQMARTCVRSSNPQGVTGRSVD